MEGDGEMIYRIHYKTKIKKDIWAGKFQCQECGQISNFHLCKIKYCGYLFYVPVASMTVKRILLCDECQSYKELSKMEYNNIRELQKIQLKNGNFPIDVIIQDFNPSEIRYVRKIIVLIWAILNAFFMAIAMIIMLIEVRSWDVLIILPMFWAMGFFPLFFAVKSVTDAHRKKKLYRHSIII